MSPTTSNASISKNNCCKACGKLFSSSNCLAIHYLVHSGERPFSCKHCNKKFSQKPNLRTHLLLHTDERPFSCGVCYKKFAQKGNLKTHLRNHTGETPFSCKYCAISFKSYHSFLLHLRVHSDKAPYPCKYCKRTFVTNSSLLAHSRLHTAKRQFSCKYCSQTFSQKKELRIHSRLHKSDNSYSCNGCDLTFLTAAELDRHSCENSNDFFICKLCDVKFLKEVSLKAHYLIHTGQRQFACTDCDRTFSIQATFLSHCLTHNEQLVSPNRCFGDTLTQNVELKSPSQTQFACNNRDKTSSIEATFLSHGQTHTEDVQSHTKDFDNTLTQNVELESSSQIQYASSDGDKTSSIQATFLSQSQTHTEDVKYPNRNFGNTLTQNFELKSPSQKLFSCNDCDQSFSLEATLLSHRETHTEELTSSNRDFGNTVTQNVELESSYQKLFSCNYCEQSFSLEATLLSHRETHTEELTSSVRDIENTVTQNVELKRSSQSLFSCSDCDQSFSLEATLLSHRETHTEELTASVRNTGNTVTQNVELKSSSQGRFSCNDCDQSFSLEATLLSHRETHTEELTSSVRDIGSTVTQNVELKSSSQGRFSCNDCFQSFSLEATFLSHRETHTEELIASDRPFGNTLIQKVGLKHLNQRRFSCNDCDQTFLTPLTFLSHRKTHTQLRAPVNSGLYPITQNVELKRSSPANEERIPNVCHYCDKNFSTELTLAIHASVHVGDRPYLCSHCDRSFPEKDQLVRHSRVHKNEWPYPCSFCSKLYSDKLSLKKHHLLHTEKQTNTLKSTKESPTPDKLTCNLKASNTSLALNGPDQFDSCKSPLKHNSVAYADDTVFPCNLCNKSYSHKRTLNHHIRTHTEQCLFPCSYCAKKFTRKYNLQEHLAIHKDKAVYSCIACSKYYAHKCSLIRHIRKHSQQCLFPCSYCDSKFTEKDDLLRHLSTHTQKGPYGCTYCEKLFSTEITLAIHSSVHVGDRPYLCSYCTEAFSQRDQLIQHGRSHDSKWPFPCSFCGKLYSDKLSLKKHCLLHKEETLCLFNEEQLPLLV